MRCTDVWEDMLGGHFHGIWLSLVAGPAVTRSIHFALLPENHHSDSFLAFPGTRLRWAWTRSTFQTTIPLPSGLLYLRVRGLEGTCLRCWGLASTQGAYC